MADVTVNIPNYQIAIDSILASLASIDARLTALEGGIITPPPTPSTFDTQIFGGSVTTPQFRVSMRSFSNADWVKFNKIDNTIGGIPTSLTFRVGGEDKMGLSFPSAYINGNIQIYIAATNTTYNVNAASQQLKFARGFVNA